MPDTFSILIAEDEDSLRTLIKEELTLHGFNVEVAEDGEVALQKLKKCRFNLVVLDILMPKVNGMEVLKKIKEENLADKVIMLTGVGELKIARESLMLGADDFIPKPYDLQTLIQCVKRLLQE